MTDFVADCVTDFLQFFVLQVGGEIVWCDICLSLRRVMDMKYIFFFLFMLFNIHQDLPVWNISIKIQKC